METPGERAAELLATVPGHVWDGASLPVPVEDVAEACFGLMVRDVRPEALAAVPGAPSAELSGLLLVHEREIWVNADEAGQWPGRRRFTVGHEVGHWVLHRPTGSVFCRASTVRADAPEDAPDIEEEASLFASALMFPPPLVRAEHARLGGDLEALCAAFGASRAAMERAVCAAIRRPLAAALGDAVAFFHFDDEGYLAWKAAHQDGYVLNDDLGPQGLLHRACCTYLARAPQPDRPATRHPKWCATDANVLRAALPARECTRCRP